MRTVRFGILVFLACLLGASRVAADAQRAQTVGPIPKAIRSVWKLDPFYVKHTNAGGLPVVGSAEVSDHAMLEAAFLITRMLARRPDILDAMVKNRVRCTVMAHCELTTDVPEHSDLKPAKFWNRRARGLGATRERPCISCAEENLLGFPGDPYPRESILIHEFAHAIHLTGLNTVDEAFERELATAYENAMDKGLWKGLYAAENKEEYWAEGVQSFFDANNPPNHLHNHVNTREELAAYDPALAKLVGRVFRDNPWRYVHPRRRARAAHLRGFDPSKAPTFTWPEGLEDWFRAYLKRKESGPGRTDLERLEDAGVRSRGTSIETSVLFVNQRDDDLSLYWLDFDGGRKRYGTVKAGRSWDQATFAGHVWLLTDASGRVVAITRARKQPGRLVVPPE